MSTAQKPTVLRPSRLTLMLAIGLETLILITTLFIEVAGPYSDFVLIGFGYALCLSFLGVGILLSLGRNQLAFYWIVSAVIPAAGLQMLQIGFQSTPAFLFSPQFPPLRQFVANTGLLWFGAGCLIAVMGWVNFYWRRSPDLD